MRDGAAVLLLAIADGEVGVLVYLFNSKIDDPFFKIRDVCVILCDLQDFFEFVEC